MTKTQSLLNAAKLADEWATKFCASRNASFSRLDKLPLFGALEAIAEKSTRHYARSDISTWNDSAGNSISARVGDYHVVSFWDGEDMLFIYQCEPDDDVSEVIGHDPLIPRSMTDTGHASSFSEAL